MARSTLVFGWGNPSRGDDALGPLFVESLESLAPSRPEWGKLSFQTDFQLQVEHALDLRGHDRVLFVDASSTSPAPFSVLSVSDERDASFSTHSMTPQAVLHTYRQVEGDTPPPAWLLAISGECFQLGAPISGAAERNLAAALLWAESWLTE